MSWQPADDELDALARTLPVPDRAADRIEQERTTVLAQAAVSVQRRRSSVVPLVAGVAAAFAAAAAVLLWIIVRPGPPPGPKERITALGPAQFEHVAPWPDFVVRVDDGRVAIEVAKLESGERFRAVTSDAEIEIRGTRFTVVAEHGHVASVAVTEGRVEIRYRGEQPVFLAAGETWSPTRTVEREQLEPAPTAPSALASPDTPKPTVRVAPTPPPRSSPKASIPTTKHIAPTVPGAGSASVADLEPAAEAPRPGEAEFRAGVAALRAGDAGTATKSFSAACTAAQGEALAEDACFWVGAAAKRAGNTATAREALTRFLMSFPASARAGEAAALLGWILYDAGELDAAKQRFDVAARDQVDKVRESAQRGLEAIKRKRAAP